MYTSMYNMFFELSADTAVLFNSLSGALFILDCDTAAALQSGDKTDLESDILKENKCIYETEQEEILYIKKIFKDVKQAQKRERALYSVVPTYGCNITCSYCPEKHHFNDTPISSTLIKKVFDAIDSLEECTPCKELPVLILEGGEPLSARGKVVKAVKHILTSADDRDFKIGIRTNGLTLHHYAPELVQFNIEYVEVVTDGMQHIHDMYRTSPAGGTFHSIQQGIDTAIDYRLNIQLRVHATRETLSTLPQMADFIVKKKWNLARNFTALLSPQTDLSCYGYRACMPDYSLLEDILELYQNCEYMELLDPIGFPEISTFLHLLREGMSLPPKFSGCKAGKTMFSFDPYGTVYPCIAASMMGIHSIGTYFPRFELFKRIDHWQNRSVFTVQQCLNCAHCFLCGGGCTLQALAEKSVNAPQCKPVEKALQLACREYLREDRAKESAFIHFSNIFIPKEYINAF